MKDIKKIIELDFLSIRPYITIKNMIIFFCLGIFYSYMNKTAVAVFGIGLLMTAAYSAYPFMVGEISGIDALYSLCGISRKKVVSGRYMTAFLLSVINTLLCSIFACVMGFIFKSELNLVIFTVTAIYSLIFMMIMIMIQYPVYFKLGHTKGRISATILMILIFIGIAAGVSFSDNMPDVFVGNSVLRIQVIIPTTIAIVAISYIVSKRLSVRFYEKRDF